MYEVKNDKVYYRGKRFQAHAASFEDLIYDFGRDKDTVYFRGKSQLEIDRPSFRMLDEFYAVDREAVYLIMVRKLKPTKADPKTFRPFGFGYGRDAENSYWKEKKIRGVEGDLYPIGLDVALDDKGVFWERRRVLNQTLDRRSARCRNELGRLVLWDQSKAWSSEHYREARELSDQSIRTQLP